MSLTTVQVQMIGGGGTQALNPGVPIYQNTQSVTSSYTITAGTNAMSVGPVSIASGVTVTIPTGSRYVIL